MNWFKRLLTVAAIGALAIAPTGAQKNDAAQTMLEAAKQKQDLEGDLTGAIKQYQAIVDKYLKTDRAATAQALLGMAECYQRLGDAQAMKMYERVVREFADQKEEVTFARARLGRTAAVASTKGDRVVWTGGFPWGRVSADGRLITGRAGGGGLSVHDVGANADRTLTPDAVPYYQQWTRHSAISRDGKQVVYEWWDANQGWRLAFRIAALPGSGFLEPRQFFLAANDDIPAGNLTSFDWSPDGKWIAAAIRRKDRTGQIALIALADGSFTVLKSMDWNVPERIFFSLDSRYIAYDLPAGDGILQRDVFVLAIDGSREVPAVVHSANEAVMGWSPDGVRLLFSSDRTGSWSLWSLPFADGKTQGTPDMLKSDIGTSYEGRPRSLGLTASGALYVHKRVSSRDITIAPIDVKAGKLLGPPVSFTQGLVGGARNPVWSPEGNYLAYPWGDGSRIAIRAVATGQVRLLPGSINYAQALLDWSPDGHSLLTRGTDLKGRNGIFQLDAQTGEVTPVSVSDGPAYREFAQWSPDGKQLYFNRGAVFVERDVASGSERNINRGVGQMGPLSPDGQYLTAVRRDQSAKTASLLLVPVAGGQPRELLRLTQPEDFMDRRQGREIWTPDGNAVVIVKDTGSHWELWLVPVTGGSPRKLDIDADIWKEGSVSPEDQGFSLSPDGRSIAFVTGKTVDEVWALENFLPAAKAKK